MTLQYDASQSGLGVALLQNEQLVANASQALISAETRYAQIEKELLAIVYGCKQPVAYASWALTLAETRYAQIEKELLAIVYRCDHFES